MYWIVCPLYSLSGIIIFIYVCFSHSILSSNKKRLQWPNFNLSKFYDTKELLISNRCKIGEQVYLNLLILPLIADLDMINSIYLLLFQFFWRFNFECMTYWFASITFWKTKGLKVELSYSLSFYLLFPSYLDLIGRYRIYLEISWISCLLSAFGKNCREKAYLWD